MGKREFDNWLDGTAGDTTDAATPKTADELAVQAQEDDARRRFRSLFYDMLHYIEDKGYGNPVNRYRLAAYAVWYTTPAPLRPVRFQTDLARLLGMSKDDNFRKWRAAYPDLFSSETVVNSVRQLIMERLPDVVLASIDCAIHGGAQGHPDRKLLMQTAGLSTDKTETVITGEQTVNLRGLEQLSDDDLANIAAGGGG